MARASRACGMPGQQADELLSGVTRRARHPDPHLIPLLHTYHVFMQPSG